MPKIAVFTIENINTGERHTGRGKELSKVIDYCHTGFSRAYKQKQLIHNEWKIIAKSEEMVEPTHDSHMYDYLDIKKLKHLDKKKVVALYESYKSGRNDFWAIENIADECGVPEETIKEVLKSEDII